jgi:hypothetical protein
VLPLNKKTTLREFLESVVHKKKFNNNDNVFKNLDELKQENSSDDDNNNNAHNDAAGGFMNYDTYPSSSKKHK